MEMCIIQIFQIGKWKMGVISIISIMTHTCSRILCKIYYNEHIKEAGGMRTLRLCCWKWIPGPPENRASTLHGATCHGSGNFLNVFECPA